MEKQPSQTKSPYNRLPPRPNGTKTIEISQSPAEIDSYSEYLSHKKSYEELIIYEQYLDHKLMRSVLVKRVLVEIITDFDKIKGKTCLEERQVKLLVFLLGTIDYLNNHVIVEELGLYEDHPSFEGQLKLPKDVIHLKTMLPSHRNRFLQLRQQFINKLLKTNQKYFESVPVWTQQLTLLFKNSKKKNLSILEYLLMEVREDGNQLMKKRHKDSFQIDNVKNVFIVFFDEIKKRIFPCIEELEIKQLTILYIFEYLISFETMKIDMFYSDKNYLKDIRRGLFSQKKQKMITYIFKTLESGVKKYEH